MADFKLYKELQKKGFPQGGIGQFIQDPNTNDKVYVPQPGEIYAQFILDPEGWQKVTDALAGVWIESRK